MRTQRGKTQKIELGTKFDRVVFCVAGLDTISFQVEMLDAAFGGTLTVKRSNNGHQWVALTTPVTITAEGMTALIPTFGYEWMALEVTTANGSTAWAMVSVYGEGLANSTNTTTGTGGYIP